MENKYVFVKQDIDKKFLKLYTAKFITNGSPREYVFCSRHNESDLAVVNEEIVPTAVEAFTYIDNKIVMIKEFRSPLNKYVYSFCAGLIEKGEDYKKAIEREVYEELGGKIKNIELCQNYPLPMCAGLTDEANYCAFVELESLDKQHLEKTEDITVEFFEIEELEKKIKNNELPLTFSGYAAAIMLINKLKK